MRSRQCAAAAAAAYDPSLAPLSPPHYINCLECFNLLKHLVHKVERRDTSSNHKRIIHGVVILLEELQTRTNNKQAVGERQQQ